LVVVSVREEAGRFLGKSGKSAILVVDLK